MQAVIFFFFIKEVSFVIVGTAVINANLIENESILISFRKPVWNF